jgi:hypothetical protein
MDFEILEKLNGFNHVVFEERRHIYTIGDKKLTSVTTLLKQFEEEKDWDEIATKYAAKNGETPEYWRDLWKQEGSIAGVKGDELHKYGEYSMANKIYDINVERVALENDKCDKIDWFEPWKVMKKLKMMWDVFWLQANGTLIPVRSEYIVGDEEIGVGGMVDQLFWNTKMKELQIWDWKTSKKIARHNDWNKLTGVLSHLDECEWNKYSLQIGIYKYIIKKNLGLDIGTCYIGWFNEKNDTYKIIKARDLDKEVEQIFQAA